MPRIRRLPSLNQLRHLAAVAEHGHFGRAAEACFVTQSSLSASIKELAVPDKRILLYVILAAGLFCRLLMFLPEPVMEDDYQRYMWDGAVTANGYNPYRQNYKKQQGLTLMCLAMILPFPKCH